MRNLLSVKKKKKKEKLIIYSNFNIILDEIELYYHPEQQRSFVSDLLIYLKKIDFSDLYKDHIPEINIIFITHSPFILSDIPKQNVLFLDKGKPRDNYKMDTFGANITDLLSDSFFFSEEDGNKILMGDFAKNKINEIIKIIKTKDGNRKNEVKDIIHLIDEPLLKIKLQEMFFEAFEEEKSKERDLNELERLAKKHNIEIKS